MSSDVETKNKAAAAVENEIEVVDVNEQIAQRKQKLSEMRKQGNPYPNDVKIDAFAHDLHDEYSEFPKEQLEEINKTVKISGRMMTRRVMGKAAFCHLQDMTGKMQVYVRRDDVQEGIYAEFKGWDLGDIVAVEGVLFKTKTGELSVHANNIRIVTKALRPMPDKFHGLSDHEMRYRQRYVDLMSNEETRKLFRIRSSLVAGIRQFLNERRFLEVETPMMQTLAGGAAARPFETHHNALDLDLYLRIAPELFLKRLVVGGFERVFEINRNFRNEGISTRHNPEFTMLEFYQAYANYEDLMDLTEEMFRYLAETVMGTTALTYQGHSYDFSKPFERLTVVESVLKYNDDITLEDMTDIQRAKQLAEKLDIPLQDHYGLGKIQIEIFEKTTEKRLMQPTFITKYPTEVSPLARKSDDDPHVTDRFEFFVGGQEIANGFSELNDAEDQAERFKRQVEERATGDLEAMPYDEDYVTALEYGMPPTAGEGIGIDRLVMLFTDSASIRDVILFPLLRPVE